MACGIYPNLAGLYFIIRHADGRTAARCRIKENTKKEGITMAKKPTARTEQGVRMYDCRICGTKVQIGVQKWRKLPTKYKRVCVDCMNAATRPIERSYHPYGPYNFFSLI